MERREGRENRETGKKGEGRENRETGKKGRKGE